MSAAEERDLVDVRIGANIRQFRKAARITQGELAATIGTTHQQVHKYERGGSCVSAARLFVIAWRLGVAVEALFAGVDAAGNPRAQDAPSPLGSRPPAGAASASFSPRLAPRRQDG